MSIFNSLSWRDIEARDKKRQAIGTTSDRWEHLGSDSTGLYYGLLGQPGSSSSKAWVNDTMIIVASLHDRNPSKHGSSGWCWKCMFMDCAEWHEHIDNIQDHLLIAHGLAVYARYYDVELKASKKEYDLAKKTWESTRVSHSDTQIRNPRDEKRRSMFAPKVRDQEVWAKFKENPRPVSPSETMPVAAELVTHSTDRDASDHEVLKTQVSPNSQDIGSAKRERTLSKPLNRKTEGSFDDVKWESVNSRELSPEGISPFACGTDEEDRQAEEAQMSSLYRPRAQDHLVLQIEGDEQWERSPALQALSPYGSHDPDDELSLDTRRVKDQVHQNQHERSRITPDPVARDQHLTNAGVSKYAEDTQTRHDGRKAMEKAKATSPPRSRSPSRSMSIDSLTEQQSSRADDTESHLALVEYGGLPVYVRRRSSSSSSSSSSCGQRSSQSRIQSCERPLVGTAVVSSIAELAVDGSDNEIVISEAGRPPKKKKGQRFFCTEFPPCKLSFTRSEHLAKHVRKHTGERPFQCHCGRRFSRLNDLRMHAQTVHINKEISDKELLAATGTRFQRQIRMNRRRPSVGKDGSQMSKLRISPPLGWHMASPSAVITSPEPALIASRRGSPCPCQMEPPNIANDSAVERHVATDVLMRLPDSWEAIQESLPESYRWDIEYSTTHSAHQSDQGCWTCMPMDKEKPKHIPLTIASVPVVLPVPYQWPPIGGVNPPPDPRPSAPIDCQGEITLEVIRDIFLTFEHSVGFYILINGLLQIIVPESFDLTWASSHLPHKFGGLKVCYIEKTMEPTMLPTKVTTGNTGFSTQSHTSRLSSILRPSRSVLSLQLNDFIEARAGSTTREKYAGRIGLKVARQGQTRLLMSTHVITEAILGRSFLGLGISRDPARRLRDDWNQQVEIWAGNAKIGTIETTYDHTAEIYPNGFNHDITIVKPTSSITVEEIRSPIENLGWLSRESWASLRQRTSALKILGKTELHRSTKCIKCNLPSEASIVGEGIFFNQSAAAGAKSLKDHDVSTWTRLVSRAVLYRVSPDFDPPNGYSGIALYADGVREDGTHGSGVVGLQSFVQRSGHPQSFNMPEGPAMEQRLRTGRIAFYGAFQVPDELRKEYTIM